MPRKILKTVAALMIGGVLVSETFAVTPVDAAGFVREIWVLGGNNNFRVNSPDAKTGPFKDRWEAQKDGVLRIDVDVDLSQVSSAELYLELWGGHPGVANKRFTLNGKSQYDLPEVGAAKGHCTYSYPVVPVKVAELRRGANSFAFTCDKAETFWGHFLIRTACLRLRLKPGCETLKDAGFAGQAPQVAATAANAKPERVALHVTAEKALISRIAEVEFWGHYDGYDENGDGEGHDWHGFTKDGRAMGHIGTRSAKQGLAMEWSLAMVPRTQPVLAKGRIRFQNVEGLVYETAAVKVADAQKPSPVRVYTAPKLPTPFWSREGNAHQCSIPLDVDPAEIEDAELHVAIWDGGAGKTKEPFTLNSVPLAVAGKGKHDLLYRVVKIDPKTLRKGENTIRVLSDTHHHGIEVLLPGPALVVRMRTDQSQKGSPK